MPPRMLCAVLLMVYTCFVSVHAGRTNPDRPSGDNHHPHGLTLALGKAPRPGRVNLVDVMGGSSPCSATPIVFVVFEVRRGLSHALMAFKSARMFHCNSTGILLTDASTNTGELGPLGGCVEGWVQDFKVWLRVYLRKK